MKIYEIPSLEVVNVISDAVDAKPGVESNNMGW